VRSNLFKLAQAAGIAFALAFTISCSDDNDDDGSQSGGGSGGSISGYRTKQIGTQTWMAENLNYDVTGSKCYGDDPANCAKYGRLYDWATAMALPASCNSTSCSGDIKPKHQGICPQGWHIPSNEDWDKLFRYVDGTSGTSSPCSSPTAGTKLKSKTDWESYSGIPAGTDEFGFSALPGGSGLSDGSFDLVGSSGLWWSSSEGSSDGAYSRFMFYFSENAVWYDDYKGNLYSVRCLQD